VFIDFSSYCPSFFFAYKKNISENARRCLETGLSGNCHTQMKSENGTTERVISESPALNGNTNGTATTNNNNNSPTTPASKKRSGDPLKCTIFNYFFSLSLSPRIYTNIDSFFGSIAVVISVFFFTCLSLCFIASSRKRRKGNGSGSSSQEPQPKNAVAILNELKKNLVYELESQEGPYHAPVFTMSVMVSN
jgi:hypothetical protein